MRGNPGEFLLLDLFSNCEWARQTPKACFFTVLEAVSQLFSWLLSVFKVAACTCQRLEFQGWLSVPEGETEHILARGMHLCEAARSVAVCVKSSSLGRLSLALRACYSEICCMVCEAAAMMNRRAYVGQNW